MTIDKFLWSITKKGFSRKETQRQFGLQHYEFGRGLVSAINGTGEDRYTLEGMMEWMKDFYQRGEPANSR